MTPRYLDRYLVAMRRSPQPIVQVVTVLLLAGSILLHGCTFAPAPLPVVGEGPPAKFDVAIGKPSDASVLSDSASATDVGPAEGGAADGVLAEGSDASDGQLEGTDAAGEDGPGVDDPLEDVDPDDTSEPDADDSDLKADSGPADSAPKDTFVKDVQQAPGFAIVWTQVLAKFGCNSAYCHGKSGLQPIFINQALSYAMLLQDAGTTGTCNGVPLVTVGKPEASLLWQKIAPDTPSCGLKMPMTSDNNGLDAGSAALVAAWIKGGAKP